MENYNEIDDIVIAGDGRPATVDDFKQVAKYADNMVTSVSQTINNVALTVAQVKQISAQVEVEFARLDHALDCLMVKAQRDRYIYEKSLPILDKQFAACQTRMDKLMDKAMEFITDDLSEASIRKQEAMMNLIEIANGSLNALISKLIPQY